MNDAFMLPGELEWYHEKAALKNCLTCGSYCYQFGRYAKGFDCAKLRDGDAETAAWANSNTKYTSLYGPKDSPSFDAHGCPGWSLRENLTAGASCADNVSVDTEAVLHDAIVAFGRELQTVREERDALRVEVSSLKTSLMLSRSVVGAKHTYCQNCGDEVILDIGQDTGLCRMCWNARGDE